MEDEKTTQDENSLENKPEINLEQIMSKVEKLEASNSRLVEQSKDWKDKYYRSMQEKEKENEAKLTDNEQWKELVEIEKNKRFELESKVKNLATVSMQKDLQYKIASLAKDAYDVDDVVAAVSRSGLLDLDKESGTINGIEEAYNKVREEKPHYFDLTKRSGMSAGKPDAMLQESKSIDDKIAEDPNAMLADVLKDLI